ncbi:MAG: DsbA family protein [Thermodesulfobacteriota bacterium]
MKLTVFYDYTCPFCYITSKNLETLSNEFDLDIEWKGIEIHPEIPSQGQKSSRSLKSIKTVESIKGAANESGTVIALPGFRTNSRLSLEASEFAKTRNRFKGFHDSIFEAYFADRKNIGDLKIVIEAGIKAGLDGAELEECLGKRTMFHKVEENKKAAQSNLVTGVPTLIMGKFPVYGNQSLETLRHMIRRAIERTA